jgi:hypothetical protein
MLSRILNEFEAARGALTLVELSRRLGIERSALEGMLRLLVRKGRLREIRPGDIQCAHCTGKSSCAVLSSGQPGVAYYELVKPSQ